MDIPPTQTLLVLIFVIFLAMGSTVVGRKVSFLMVCMTGCHVRRGGFPLSQRMPLPSLDGDPHLSSVLFLIHFSAISSLSVLSNPTEKKINLGPVALLATPTTQLASIVCN